MNLLLTKKKKNHTKLLVFIPYSGRTTLGRPPNNILIYSIYIYGIVLKLLKIIYYYILMGSRPINIVIYKNKIIIFYYIIFIRK